MAVRDGDVVLVPRVTIVRRALWIEMYYLNVMAGPLRKWRFVPAQRSVDHQAGHLTYAESLPWTSY
jgi:5-deoxy-D-glucuronate isomerase